MSLKVDRAELEIVILNSDANRKRMRELDESMIKLNKEIKKLPKNSDEWIKKTAEFKKLGKEYDEVLSKVNKNSLSIKELTYLQKQLNLTLQALPADSPFFNQYRKRLDEVNAKLKEMKGTSKDVGGSLSKFGGSLQVFAGNMMTKAISYLGDLANKAKEFVIEGVQMANKAEGIVSAFQRLNAPDLLNNLRQNTKGLVSDLQLMTISVRASNFGIPLEKLGSLLKFAQQRAQETGESVDYLSESIIMGIGRKSALILDNLGISAARLQAEVKKTGDFAGAAIKIVNEELEKQGTLALTSADIATQASVKWENAQLKIGQRFQWLGSIWDKISSSIADGITSLAGETKKASDIYEDQLGLVAKLNVNTSPLIDKYEQLSKKVKLNYDQTEALNPEQEELLRLINEIKGSIPGVVTEFDNLGRAMGINTQAAKDYIAVQIEILKYNNRDLIIEKGKEAEKASKHVAELNKQLALGGEYETIGGSINYSGRDQVKFRTFSPEEKGKIQEDLSFWIAEETKANNVVNELNGVSVEERLKIKSKEETQRNTFAAMNKKQLDAWIKDERNAKDEYLSIAKSIYNQRFGTTETTDKPDKSAEQRQKLSNALTKLEEKHLQDMAELQKKYLSGELKTQFDFDQASLAAQDDYDNKRKAKLKELLKTLSDPSIRLDISKQIADIDKKNLDRQVDQANKLKKIILDADPIAAEKESYDNRLRELKVFGETSESLQLRITASETAAEKQKWQERYAAFEILKKQHTENMQKLSTKEARLALKQLDTDEAAAVKVLNERRISEKMSEQQYKDELLQIEIDYLNKRLLVNGVSAEKMEEINKQINVVTGKGIADKGEAREAVLEKFNLKSLNDQKQAEYDLLQYWKEKGIISKEEALKIEAQLDQKYLDASLKTRIDKFSKVNETIQQIGGNLTGTMNNLQSAEEDAISRKYDMQIKAAEGNAELQKKLETEKQAELNKVRAKYADKQFAVQAAMIVSETALAAMRAYSALASIPIVGLALGAVAAGTVVAFGASQLKAASEAREAAKAGYQSGGFTSSSIRDDQEAGVVHANEFVANAKAVRNPSVRKFLDVFDMAQKNGTIHMMNTTQILEKVRYESNNGFQSGGYSSKSGSSGSSSSVDHAAYMRIIENNTIAMNKMTNELENGIPAYSVISGDDGSYRQTERYKTLLKNKSRQ